MREVNKNKHRDLWIQALEAKFEDKGDTWERQDFEKILAGFEVRTRLTSRAARKQHILTQDQGVSDYPAAIFAEELIRVYPEACIVLSTRSEDSWYDSMMSTLVHHHHHRSAGGDGSSSSSSSPVASLAAKYHAHCWGDDFPSNGRACFRRHNDLVRSLAGEGGRAFLEYDVETGWGPLCAFLGVPVPEGPMPRSDDWVEYKKGVMKGWEERQRARTASEEIPCVGLFQAG